MADTAYVYPGYWVNGYGEGDNAQTTFSALQTVASQYANSPTLLQLITNVKQTVDPSLDFQGFYDYVYNVATAQGFGLDILGRVVNIGRQINVPSIYPFTVAAGVRSLSDDQYRNLVLLKAYTNINGNAASDINAALRVLFPSRGTAYVIDQGNMSIAYRFLFGLSAYEFGIMQTSNIVPRPAAVKYSFTTVQPYFGFNEANSWSTFGEAPFAAY